MASKPKMEYQVFLCISFTVITFKLILLSKKVPTVGDFTGRCGILYQKWFHAMVKVYTALYNTMGWIPVLKFTICCLNFDTQNSPSSF